VLKKVGLQKGAYKKYGKKVMPSAGFEPTTTSMQGRCSTSWVAVSEECSSSFLYNFALNSLFRAYGSTHELALTKFE